MRKTFMIYNKRIFYGIITCFLLAAGAFLGLKYYPRRLMDKAVDQTVTVISGGTYQVPSSCKHLALLGSTPHPTQYLHDHDMDYNRLWRLQLEDFIDVEQLQESFKN